MARDGAEADDPGAVPALPVAPDVRDCQRIRQASG